MSNINLAEGFITAKEIQRDFASIADRVQDGEQLVVTRKGHPALVMVNVQDYEAMQEALDVAAHVWLADEAQVRADRGEALTGDQFITWLQAKTGAVVDFEKEDPADYLEMDDNDAEANR